MKSTLLLIIVGMIPCSISDSIARGKPTSQGSVYKTYTSEMAVDGNYNQRLGLNSCSHLGKVDTWWTVDLLGTFVINRVTIYNRENILLLYRLNSLYVRGFMGDPYICPSPSRPCGYKSGPTGYSVAIDCPNNTTARYIRLKGRSDMTLCEVDVIGQAVNAPKFRQWTMARRSRTVVKSNLQMGSTLSPTHCLAICLHRPYPCTFFYYNVVDGSCVVPANPLKNNSLERDDNWNLYFTCWED